MSVSINKNGYFEISYVGQPYGGLHVQLPELLIPDNCSPKFSNFMLRNGELRSRPNFALEFINPDKNPSIGLTSFRDANGTYHTVKWDGTGLWQLSPSGQPPGSQHPWTSIGGPAFSVLNPMSYWPFANVLYYTNGSGFMASWDGMTSPVASVASVVVGNAPTVGASLPGGPTMVGPLSIGGLYLGELDSHLILANVQVIDTGNGNAFYSFPNLVWWAASNIPNQFDPVANNNAGFNPLLDVPDQITGMVTLGVAGYIFRSNGITQFNPTGRAILPFQFDHMWASEQGIGSVFPWSIASYGSLCCFISQEQIYQMGVNTVNPIGGGARDAIFADLYNATTQPVANILPVFQLGYVYLTYVVSVPLGNYTRHYVYSFEENNWSPWDTSGLVITGRPDTVWSGALASLGVPGVIPAASVAGGGGSGGGSGGGGGGQGGGGGGGGGRGHPVI